MNAIRCIFVFAIGAACLLLLPSSPRGLEPWHEFAGGRWQQLPPRSPGPAGFQLLSPARTGLAFTNRLSEEDAAANRTLYDGSGVAAGDIDGDGLPDLVFVGLSGEIALFKNLGNWRFSNITTESGLSFSTNIWRGAVLADITGDGALDLLLSASGSGVHCWRNDGKGHFSDITPQAGAGSKFASLTMTLADVDGNGTLDLYVANNRVEDIRDQGQVQLRLVHGKTVVPPALATRIVLINGQVFEYGEPDALFLNDGAGRFKHASWTDGTFLDENNAPLRGPPLDWGLTAKFYDLNGDGAPDLYVCNDFWTPDRLWINDGKGHFRAAPRSVLRHTSGSSMGVDMADLNFDGRPEIFVVDMLSRFPSWRKRQLEAQPLTSDPPGLIYNRPQILRNTLFQQRPDSSFAEIAEIAGLPASEWAWQPVFLDVDLDGHPDLLITTGHAHDVQDRDAESKVRALQRNYSAITNLDERKRVFRSDLLAHSRLYPKLETPVVAFRNNGDMTFTDATPIWGTDSPGVHHGIAIADFDGDGDLDFAVNNLNGPAGLYKNNSSAPLIAIRLRGLSPNTQAIGARLTLFDGAVPVQRQEIVSGGRYLSGSDPLAVFATGPSSHPMRLEIRWRDGAIRTIADLQPNRLYEIVQTSALDSIPSTPPASTPPPPLFEDLSPLLVHVHHQDAFDDFSFQPLLPWKLSQLGPGIAWADLDDDGWEDLFIGSGASGTIGAFRNNQHGGFVPWTNAPFSQKLPRDTTTLLSFPAAPHKNALIAGLASYEDGRSNTASLFLFPPEAAGPSALFKDLPASIGPLALADYEGNGTLGLFIGGRLKTAQWPSPVSSLLLKRSNGVWIPDTQNSPLFSEIGCVAGATWTDLDGDGYPELVLACEWGPIRIFKNNHGRLAPAPWSLHQIGFPPATLNSLSGLWSGIAAADFDGDGRIDLIAGNWGENSEFHASPAQPLLLFSGPWSGSESLALVETTFDPIRQLLTPARPLDQLGVQLPFLVGKFSSYRAFSEASLDEVLGPFKSSARPFQAATLKTTLFLNRGDHFELRPLPREVQFSPVFGIAVSDFDGDGFLDLFLAQNFFATRPGMPRLDASRGLLLRGDGRGGFTLLDSLESGIAIDGEQRGAAVADFDHDGRPDLVVTQNGAATRLFHNKTGHPGVRVRLVGPPSNPAAIGAQLRLSSTNTSGPLLEIHAGSGYWSQDSSTLILPRPSGSSSNDPLHLEVRWPGGKKTTTPVPPAVSELVVPLAPK